MKLELHGQRHTINLRTPNLAAASSKAADIYKTLITGGWDAVFEMWKPKPPEPTAKPITVGEFIKAASSVCTARPATLNAYAACLRRIVAEVANLPRVDRRGRSAKSGVAQDWRTRVDALPLGTLTEEKVMAWRLGRLRQTGGNLAAQRTAKTTINAVLRNAKALFSPRITRHISRVLCLPPNPFAEVPFFERASTRYHSRIDTAALIEAARLELGGSLARLEEWKAFVLLMFAGLRRNEADKLRWFSVDFSAGTLRVEGHEDFLPKCESSLGVVELDPEIMAMLKEWRAMDERGGYVLRSDVLARSDTGWSHYRAGRAFDALATWLREKGVTANKPLHELRKEAGSVVAQKHGIYAASRFLRHADIGITSAHYVDKKERVTVGLGGLLGGAADAAATDEKLSAAPDVQAWEINTQNETQA